MADLTEKDSLEPHEFAQAVLGKIQGLDDEPTEETPVAEAGSTVITEDTVRHRDPETGQFTSPPQAGEEQPEGEPAPEEGQFIDLDIDDPEVAAFLAKYDGDLEKALRGATELQKMSGRQGGELGELRQQLAAMQEMLGQVAQAANRPASSYNPVLAAQLIGDDPEQAANLAYQAGDMHTLAAAVEQWKEEDPFRAAVFVSNLQNQNALRGLYEAVAQTAPAQIQTPAQGQAELDAEVSKVVERHPDLEKHLPTMGEIAAEMPLLQVALEEGTPQARAMALEALVTIAKSRGTPDTSREALARVQLRIKAEGEAARANAAVVSGGTRQASDGQPTGVDQFKQSFRQHLGLPLDE